MSLVIFLWIMIYLKITLKKHIIFKILDTIIFLLNKKKEMKNSRNYLMRHQFNKYFTNMIKYRRDLLLPK
jgi:hypothetical protein